jgi:hypothetical protein
LNTEPRSIVGASYHTDTLILVSAVFPGATNAALVVATMKDVPPEPEAESAYECFDCGTVVRGSAPDACPDCGAEMRNRRMPIE